MSNPVASTCKAFSLVAHRGTGRHEIAPSQFQRDDQPCRIYLHLISLAAPISLVQVRIIGPDGDEVITVDQKQLYGKYGHPGTSPPRRTPLHPVPLAVPRAAPIALVAAARRRCCADVPAHAYVRHQRDGVRVDMTGLILSLVRSKHTASAWRALKR